MHTARRMTSLWGISGCVGNRLQPTSASSVLRSQHRTTTILCIRKGNEVVMMGDKRVTLGQSVIAKDSARKLRRAGSYSAVSDTEKKSTDAGAEATKFSDPSTVLVGFAGSTADAMTLLEKLEAKLNEFPAQLLRAAVELAKEWRGDKMLRRLEASMIVADINETLEIDGSGNVLTPDSSNSPAGQDEGIVAIGSGGQYAKSAARALMKFVNAEEKDSKSSKWSAEMICRASMEVAASIDVFTSKQFDVDRLHIPPPPEIAEKSVEDSAASEVAKADDAKPESKAKAKKSEDAKSKGEKKGAEEKAKKNSSDASAGKK